jgi:hypothetical protein
MGDGWDTGQAFVDFDVASVPSGGELAVWPEQGVSGLTEFRLDASGWSDASGLGPRYSFFVLDSQGKASVMGPIQSSPRFEGAVVWLGASLSQGLVGLGVRVHSALVDSAFVDVVANVSIEAASVADIGAVADGLLQALEQAIASGNTQAIQLAMSNVLNALHSGSVTDSECGMAGGWG